MNEVFLLGLKQRVTAISKLNGQIVWSTQLSGGMRAEFVTVVCDGSRVFAYAGGHLHCLELASGRLLWTNELPGFGFGIASLCFPGGDAAPSAAAVQVIAAAQQAAASAVPPIAAT